MTSRTLDFFQQTDFTGGICDSQENIKPNQVLDARDCWAPVGILERRPAYRTVSSTISDVGGNAFGTPAAISVDATTGALSNLAVAAGVFTVPANVSALYVGSLTAPPSPCSGVAFQSGGFTVANQSIVSLIEYWNGSVWKAVQYVHTAKNNVPPTVFYANGQGFSTGLIPPALTHWAFQFALPADFTQTTVNSVTRYWIRITFLNGIPTSGNINGEFWLVPTFFPYVCTKKFAWNTGNNYLNVFSYGTGAYVIYNTAVMFRGASYATVCDLPGVTPSYAKPPTFATIPEFSRTFMAFGGSISELSPASIAAAPLNSLGVNPFAAVVNSNPLIVGTDPLTGIKSPYHPDYVPQLASFPKGTLITYFKGLLWSTGFLDDINLIRWSAPAIDGAYNVWPEDSFEHLSTGKDNTAITGIAPLGDNLVVFKKDSIWQMVFEGLNDLNLPMFTPELVVAGVGTTSPDSIQEINGRLVFLAEDGFYAFNGTPNILKLSDNINDSVAEINPARTPFATAINWRRKHCYMCATNIQTVGQSGVANNVVFVWDYKHNSWWIWNMPVKTWIQEYGVGLKEEVYFANDVGQFFQLERGGTDNGTTINPYVLTTRFGEDDIVAKTTREVRVRAYNSDGTINIQLFGEDKTLGEPTYTVTMNATTETLANPPPLNGCDNVETRRRERKHTLSMTADWFQVKVSAFDTLQGIDVGFEQQSRR